MFCRNCGNSLRDGAAFCPQCGARIAAPEPPLTAAPTLEDELNDLLARAALLTDEPMPAPEAPQSAAFVPPAAIIPEAPQPAGAPKKTKSRAGLIVLLTLLGAVILAVAAFFALKPILFDRSGTTISAADRGKDDRGAKETTDANTDDPDAVDAPSPNDPETETNPTENEPAVPAEPTAEELMDQAEAFIAAGEYEQALAALSLVTTAADAERFDTLVIAAMFEATVTVDCAQFPTVLIEVRCNSPAANLIAPLTLTEDGEAVSAYDCTAVVEQARGETVLGFRYEAAAGGSEPSERSVCIELGIGAVSRTVQATYPTPRLVSRYELIFADLSWEAAAAECERLGGHLMTITSAEEMETAIALAAEHAAAYTWIGGYTTIESDGTVSGQWITGEVMDYTNWADGEPSGADRDGTVESCMMLWNVPSLGGWTWNDQRPDPIADGFFSGQLAFICEWEEYVP